MAEDTRNINEEELESEEYSSILLVLEDGTEMTCMVLSMRICMLPSMKSMRERDILLLTCLPIPAKASIIFVR